MSESETTGFKFLAIKNWHKYQGGKMKNGNEKRPWVKDYVDKDADTLDACCRLRGRIGKNLPNDPTWIGRALCVLPAERAHLSYAINALTKRHFLLLSNEEHDFTEERRGEEIREDKTPRGESAVVLHAPKSESKPKAPPLRIVAAYDDEKIHGPKKPARYAQADFDARDLRKMNAAYQELERADQANLGRQKTRNEKEIFEWVCSRSGITVARGIELEELQKRWPGGLNVGAD